MTRISRIGKRTIPDEIQELLRWSDWIRAYRATAEFFERRLAALGAQE
jgi:hypothetical protein